MSFLKKLFGFGKKSEKKTAAVHSHTSPKNGNLMLALEERYLYDAAGLAVAFEALTKPHTDAVDHHVDSDHSAAAEKSLPDILKDAVAPAAHVQKASEIVFIDPSVTDYQKIIESIPAKDQVIILDPNKDGVQQISEVLSHQTDVKAIHIVSHGSDASLTLGNTQLSKDTIENYAPMLTGWKDSLQQGADILIYGCNVAKDADGKAFTDRISQLTGADTAASDDVTGAADKGGDWVLEYQTQTGLIEVEGLTPKNYQYELAIITVTNGTDNVATGDGVTLREAIQAANTDKSVDSSIAGSGDDIIRFDSSLNGATITIASATVDDTNVAGDFDINSNLTIEGKNGSGTPITITIDGGAKDRVFNILGGTVTLDGLNITGGNASSGGLGNLGGGILVQNAGTTLNLYNSAVYGNSSTSHGGGIFNHYRTVNIYNCTISSNNAGGSGGGIYNNTNNTDTGTLTITSSTIRNNTGVVSGGIFNSIDTASPYKKGTVEIYSSIIFGNTIADLSGGTANSGKNYADISVVDHSLYGTLTTVLITSPVSNQTGTPDFETLFDYYGGTTKIWALKDTANNKNIVINKGGSSSLTTDQRGVSRVSGDNSDIGAYEYNTAPSVDTTKTNVLAAIDEDDTANSGTSVDAIIQAGAITDTDYATPANAPKAIAVTKVDNTNGIWQYSTNNGVSWSTFTATTGIAVDISSSAILLNHTSILANTNKIRFVPNLNYNTTTGAGIEFRAWDKTDVKTAGTSVNITSTGGNTPFSANIGTANIIVNPVNDAPTLDITDAPDGGGNSLIVFNSVSKNSTNPAGTTISAINIAGTSIFGTRIDDADTGALKGIAITSVDNTNGKWQYKVGAGLWTDIPTTAPSAVGVNNALLLSDTDMVRFIPNPNYDGRSNIEFRAWDQSDSNTPGTFADTTTSGTTTAFSSNIAQADIIVGNTPPVAVDDVVTISINQSVDIDVLNLPVSGKDYDPDGAADTLSVVSFDTTGTKGTVSKSGNILKYKAPNWTCTDEFKYTIQDLSGATSTATVKIQVGNTPPTARDDSFSVIKNKATTMNVIANDSDIDIGDALTPHLVAGPSHGTLTDNGNGTYTYTPATDYLGADSFVYRVTDKAGAQSNNATVSITVDDNIVAETDNFSTNENTSLTIKYSDLSSNDGNPKNFPLTFYIKPLQSPVHGTLTNDPMNNSVYYQPYTNVAGVTDWFQYTIVASNGSISTANVGVTINPKADMPNLDVPASLAFTEDQALSLSSISASLADPSGETLSVKVSGMPSGTTLSQGVKNGDGSWTLTSEQLATVKLTPPSNYSGSFTLTVDAIATETANGDTAKTTKNVTCTVTPVADAPVWKISHNLYIGDNNQPISLPIELPQLTDTDGSERLTDITISDVPSWVSFNVGTNNGDGTWTITPSQLSSGLVLIPNGGEGSMFLNLRVGSVEQANNSTAYTDQFLDITSQPEAPKLEVSDVSGNEDTGIPLSISASLNNEALVLTDVSIIGLPNNATLSNTLKLQDGTWLVANEHLANLTLTPPANSGDDIHLTAMVSSMDEDGNTVTSEKTFTVDVVPKADMPNLTVYSPIYGADSAPVPLIITSSLTDTDGSETLSVKISDVPDGVTLSAGQNLGSGVWLLQPSELSGLTLTAPTGAPTFTLTVRAYATETENSDQVYAEKTLDVVFGPVAENDLIETDVNKASVPFNPLDNDKGYQITLLSYDTPAHGTLSKNDGGKLIYTPATDYKGADSFTYKIADNLNRQATGTVNIKVGVINTAPDAKADSYETAKDTAITINAASGVLSNDTDIDSDPLTAIKASDPANGVLTLNSDGSFIYTPNTGFTGIDTFTYKANDGKLDSNAAAVTIKVVEVALDAVDDVFTVQKNVTTTIKPLENDKMPAGTTVDKITQPSHGILADNNDGTYDYQPAIDYVGTDSFTYTLSDGKGNTDTATVSITVAGDHIPVAVDDTGYSVDQGKTLTISAKGVLSNDTDEDGDTLTAVKVSDPANGVLTLNSDGSFTYTPNTGFTGIDTFTYKANDGKADSASAATVTITVREVTLDAVDDTVTVQKNGTVTITPLANDKTPAGTVFDKITAPSHGILADNGDGTYIYQPSADYVGSDSFTYTLSDGKGNTDTAAVSITVTDINTPPVANADNYNAAKDTALTIAAKGVLANDTDVDNDPLTAVKVSDPANGTLTLNADGSFVYTPNTGFTGIDTFTYKANDGKQDSLNPAAVTITVTGNRPPIAVNDTLVTDQNKAVTISFGFLMQNDSDPDGDTISISPDYTSPANGKLERTADAFIYTPNTGFSGKDAFTYTISDGKGGTASATVNITVNFNRNPVAADDYISTTRETPVTISYDFMKQNDYDPDGDTLSIPPGYSVPANGQIAVNSNGFVYTPNAGFVGSDSFIYSLSDGKGGFSQARVYVTVNQKVTVNTLPNAGNDTVSTEYNTPISISSATLLSNDTDADGDVLTISPDFTMPSHGKLERNGDNFVYTPATGYTGTDSFTYIVSDGRGGTDSATVTITVKAPYQPPVYPGTGGGDYYVPTTPTTPVVAADDALSVSKNAILNFKGTDILANDKTDGSRDILTITSFTQPSYGTLVKKADGTFAYVPSQNFIGSDSFTYTVSDGQTSSTAKVNISVLEPAGIIANDDTIAVSGTTVIKADTLLANDVAINTYDRLTISGFTQPSHGLLVDNGNNTFTYTPYSGYTGTDSFGYTITDGRGNKASATVRLNVGVSDDTDIPPDDDDDDTDTNHSPVTADDHLNATQDSSMTFTAAQILANDTDADNDVLSISGIEQPYDGTLTDNGNGTYTYTPNSGFTGEDSFAYTVSDGKGGTATGVVYINVSSKDIPPPDQDNHAPVGVDDALSTRVNTQLSIVKNTLVRNDGDVDGDTLSVSAFTQPVYGTISDKGDGTLTYSPLNSFTGQDSFTYTVSDGKGGTSSAKVTVYVNSYGSEQKIFPDAIDDEASTSQNVPITITGQTMLANDKEPQGNPLTIIGYTQAYNGTVVKDSSGNYVYTPNSGFTGRDIFSYTVSNGKGGTDTAWVRITVGSSATRSADSVRRSADRAETSDTQSSNNSATDASLPLPAPEPIVVPADSSVTVTPIVIAASVSESEEQSLTLPQEGTPYQKESYVSVSGQTVFDVKADKNYQEWIRTAVYDRNDILAANYGGGDSAEIIRYQAYFKARETDNPSLWKDRNTATATETGGDSETVDKRIVAKNESNIGRIGLSEEVRVEGKSSDVIAPLDIIESLSQADTNMLSFSEQIQLASGGFEGERTDFLSRLGALL